MSIHRTSLLGGSALLALFTIGTPAGAQDQPAQDQPAQNQPAQNQPGQDQPAQNQPGQNQPAQTGSPQQPAPLAPPSQNQPGQNQPAETASPQQPAPPAPPSQIRLPQLTITAPVRKPSVRQIVRRPPPPAPAAPPARAAAAPPAPAPAAPPAPAPAAPPTDQATIKNDRFDAARANLYTTIGTTSDTISHDTIEALPQGTNETVEKVLLQAPGVSQDSAASGLLHVRNDHANVQFRINGVMLPDGVTGFGSIFDTSLIGTIALVTGALPSEFGMRTVGLVDITTRTDAFNNSGSVSFYGGSRGTIQPSFEYGGTFGSTCPKTAPPPGPSTTSSLAANCFPGVQYFFSGRYLQTTEGIENELPTLNAIHDFSQQEKGFAYMSAFVDPYTRLSLIAGTATSSFQIPNVTDKPVGTMGNPPVTSVIRRHHFQFRAAQREPIRANPIRHAGVAAIGRTASTGNCPISPATTICTSRPIRSATCSSTASPRISAGNPIPTASRATAPMCSRRRIRCAPASPSAANRPGSTIHRSSRRRREGCRAACPKR